MDYGAVSLIPTALVLLLAIWSHRTLESVICGAILAFLIMDGWQFADRLAVVTTQVLADESTAWVLLVCGLYGSFIALLVRVVAPMRLENGWPPNCRVSAAACWRLGYSDWPYFLTTISTR
jgi:Na+/H+ antiporter NhaC